MNILLFAAAAFLIVLLLGPVVIPFLRRLKFGQEIREIGPIKTRRVRRPWAG